MAYICIVQLGKTREDRVKPVAYLRDRVRIRVMIRVSDEAQGQTRVEVNTDDFSAGLSFRLCFSPRVKLGRAWS